MQELEHLENFLDEIKRIFHNYLRLLFDEKMNNSRRKLSSKFTAVV